MSAEAQCLCLCREVGGCLCTISSEGEMLNKEYVYVEDGAIVTQQEKRRQLFNDKVDELDRAVAWIRSYLDSFPEIPSIMFYGSGVRIGFGHISYGSKMMAAIHNVFAGKPAKKRLSSSTWHYELNDPDSGLSFSWYVFNETVSQSDCEVIL